jgi:catechol 2,3-dioxygenase-like lactoylglutathione lyase family enzyme
MKKLLLILLFVSFSKPFLAQETTSISMVFNHVSLSVKDVDVSADFYKSALNLNEIVNRTEVDGIRWFSLGEDKELHLISIVKSDVTINKAVHFALSTPTFDAFVANLEHRYIPYSSWVGEENKITIRADGIKQIYVQDPDGYWIEVNSVAQM